MARAAAGDDNKPIDNTAAGQERGQVPLPRTPGLTLVCNTAKGRGVFATQAIAARTVIEVCPVLVLEQRDVREHVSKTRLSDYTYNWPASSSSSSSSLSPSSPSSQQQRQQGAGGAATQAIVLGLGSMFNHSSYAPNVGWTRDLLNECVVYTATMDINAGEELCISYGSGPLWFDDADEGRPQEEDAGDVDGLGGLERIETLF